MKLGKLPTNQKLWQVRMDYVNEGGEIASSRSILLTYNAAVAFRQEMTRDRPDCKWTIEISAVAVDEYEKAKELKRLATKRKAEP